MSFTRLANDEMNLCAHRSLRHGVRHFHKQELHSLRISFQIPQCFKIAPDRLVAA